MKTSIALAGLAAAAFAAPALAGSVTQIQPGAAGEPSVAEIGNAVMGQSFSLAQYNTLGGGVASLGANAGRLSDDVDQVFKDGIVSVTFTALFWGGNGINDPVGSANHTFGYSLDNGAKQDVFNTGSTGLNDSVTISPAIGSGDIRWFAERGNNTAWSDPSLNSAVGATGSTDRMVAFNLDGLSSIALLGPGGGSVNLNSGAANRFSYLLFFDTGRDGDYNDLVVLVEGVANVIPLPSNAALGLAGLTAIGLRRRR